MIVSYCVRTESLGERNLVAMGIKGTEARSGWGREDDWRRRRGSGETFEFTVVVCHPRVAHSHDCDFGRQQSARRLPRAKPSGY